MTAPDPAAEAGFEAARARGLATLHERQGIGTLGERSLHAILKYWVEPDDSRHEIPLGLGRIVADVFDGERVTEIQTRNFNTLRPKLARILPLYPATVVYPVARVKRLIWVNPETGETTPPRRSPKTGRVWDVFHELYRLRPLLPDDRFTLRVVLLDMEEYRLQDGWSRDGKKGSHRMERLPTALGEVFDLRTPADYAALLPPDLPHPFTGGDLARLARIPRNKAGEIINIMYTIEAIIRKGKSGRSYTYEIAAAEPAET